MTRDTDRPRRGTDKPAFAKTGGGRPSPKTGASSRPTRGPAKTAHREGKISTNKTSTNKATAAKPAAAKPAATKPAATKPAATKASRGKPKPSQALGMPASSALEPVATIVQPERQRIAKLMARVGLCSRRDAEAWIVEGRVTLNGEILTSPATDVGPSDTILVDGILLPAAEKTRLFLFHKPRGLVTSDHDPEGRETVADHLAAHWPDGPRVVTIGRLDINTEGLLLLTNDGGLARVLELPATGWLRRYRVRAKGETDQGVLDRLREGIVVDGVDYAGIEAKLDRSQGANCWLTMGLREGKNREIKRVLEHLGLEVNRLIRVSFGPFQLLDLAEGKVEEVKTRVLRDQLGETLAAEAGVDFANADAPIVKAPVTPPLATREKGARITRPREGATPERRIATRREDRLARPATDDRGTRGRVMRDRDDVGSQPVRERPVAGTRRHVSTLRAEVASDLREGPRKRIERTDTTDRKDRVVRVERLVSTRSPETEPRARRGAGRLAPHDGQSAFRKPAREHASPSALAKRERVAKSGAGRGPVERIPAERIQERRGEQRKVEGAETRSDRPVVKSRGKPFLEDARARPARARESEHRAPRSGQEKPSRRERAVASPRPAPSASGPPRGERPARATRRPREEGVRAGGENAGVRTAGARKTGGRKAGARKDGETSARPARGGSRKPAKPRPSKR